MAKKDEYVQSDLFPESPRVAGLGITKFEISGAGVKATVEGVTNTNDIALLDNPCWQKAVTAWALSLHGGDVDEAIISMKKAYVDHINSTGEPHRPTVETFEDAQLEVIMREKETSDAAFSTAQAGMAETMGDGLTPPTKNNSKGKATTGAPLTN
jgi:hypothetical protein